MTRRDWLKTGAAAALLPVVAPSGVGGQAAPPPGDRPRIGQIGCGGNGRGHINSFVRDVVAVCDVDQKHLAAGVALVKEKTGREPRAYRDYREMLESPDLDAVVISTPDHWHALPTIDACLAGKDVYVEKPLTLTVHEGRAMTQVARATGRVVQTGSQQRSEGSFRRAVEVIRSGRLGRLSEVEVALPGVNMKGEKKPDGTPPSELDYNAWLGPAPERPYNPQRVHYYFRFFWDYSGGQMTNWGAHHLDIVQWALGQDESGPVRIEGTAGYHAAGLYEVPEWYEVTYTYADGLPVHCKSGRGGRVGVTFRGERGSLYVTRGKVESDPAELLAEPLADGEFKLPPVAGGHKGNWLACIRNRERPVADVAIGHRSATVCHLGNIAIRTGRPVTWDPVTETVVGDAEQQALCSYAYRAPWRLPEA